MQSVSNDDVRARNGQPELDWMTELTYKWLITYRDGLSVYRSSPTQVVTGPGVEQLR